MKKRLTAIIISLTMVLSCLPTGIYAEPVDTVCEHLGTTGWQNVTASTGLPTASGNYVLTEDIDLTAVWQIGTGVDISLCLNGHTIKQTTNGQRVIYVIGVLKIAGTDTAECIYGLFV